MRPPIVSFITFNRAVLVAKNLEALLKTEEDFELYIVDNHSTDDTWKYIESIKDERIKCKQRFDKNRGCIYGVNFVLSHRKKDQYFIHSDSDVEVKSKRWFSDFMKAFDLFPNLGMVGAANDSICAKLALENVLSLKRGFGIYELPAITGCFICIRPEIFDLLGYYSEETCGADLEIAERIRKFTPYKIAILPSLPIDQTQWINCEDCKMRDLCSLGKKNAECMRICQRNYKHIEFNKQLVIAKRKQFFQDIAEGKRTPYCASIHDQASIDNHYYDKESAEENFRFFIENTD